MNNLTIAAIIFAGVVAGFGPKALEAFQQNRRDASFACSMYRLSDAGDELAKYTSRANGVGGKLNLAADRAETEARRKAGGCSYR